MHYAVICGVFPVNVLFFCLFVCLAFFFFFLCFLFFLSFFFFFFFFLLVSLFVFFQFRFLLVAVLSSSVDLYFLVNCSAAFVFVSNNTQVHNPIAKFAKPRVYFRNNIANSWLSRSTFSFMLKLFCLTLDRFGKSKGHLYRQRSPQLAHYLSNLCIKIKDILVNPLWKKSGKMRGKGGGGGGGGNATAGAMNASDPNSPLIACLLPSAIRYQLPTIYRCRFPFPAE